MKSSKAVFQQEPEDWAVRPPLSSHNNEQRSGHNPDCGGLWAIFNSVWPWPQGLNHVGAQLHHRQSGHTDLLHGNFRDTEVGFCSVQEFEEPESSRWFQNTELHQNTCVLTDGQRFLDLPFSFFQEMTREA